MLQTDWKTSLNTPILHHYPASLFSEKIRTLLGYLRLDWQSVIIPAIMPRPALMPLSGGYRKTPIMQIGANVYCDTEIICRKLAELGENDTLYAPGYAPGFAAERIARWADTELFRTTVALNFRPEALATQMSQLTEAEIEAFQKDRAELSGGAPIVGVDPGSAQADFCALLAGLEGSLSDQEYLLGTAPSIADFSLYHCLWFVSNNPANRSLFEPWPAVQAYLDRMQAFGHGNVEEVSAEQALAIGTDATPVSPTAEIDEHLAGALNIGDTVTVAPNDYGRIPVTGRLVAHTSTEIVIEREDDTAGEIMVHFPNIGFDLSAV